MKLTIEHAEDFHANFDRLMKLPANRQAYLASRAWQMRRQALAIRSDGKCERCNTGKYQIAHHLTYAHFGREYLPELQALCRDCHAYLHGKTELDPAVSTAEQMRLF